MKNNKPAAKSDQRQMQIRMQTVWQWIAMGYSNAQIRAAIMEQWAVTERTAFKYTKAATEYAKKEVVQDVELSFAFHLETRREMLRSLQAQKEELKKLRVQGALTFKEATELLVKVEDQILKTLADIAKLDGSYSPTKNEVNVTAQKQIYRLPDGSEVEF